MRARKANTQVRRDQIARAALSVVQRHGLRGLSVARLAKTVGVVPSALYRHYPDKASVLRAMTERIAEHLNANLAHARATEGNALERLHQLLIRHVELVITNSAIPRVVFSEELLHGRPAQRRRLFEIVRGYLRQVAELLREGQHEGCVRADLDPDAASLLFLGLIQPAVLLHAMSAGECDLAAHAEAGWKLFVNAVS